MDLRSRHVDAIERQISGGAGVAHNRDFESEVGGCPYRRLNAHVGLHAANDKPRHAEIPQRGPQIRIPKGVGVVLTDDRLSRPGQHVGVNSVLGIDPGGIGFLDPLWQVLHVDHWPAGDAKELHQTPGIQTRLIGIAQRDHPVREVKGLNVNHQQSGTLENICREFAGTRTRCGGSRDEQDHSDSDTERFPPHAQPPIRIQCTPLPACSSRFCSSWCLSKSTNLRRTGAYQEQQEDSVMGRFGWMVVCVVVFSIGCGTASEPEAEAIHDFTAVSPAQLLARYQQASEAYDAGEIDSFLELTSALVEEWPDHPRLIYNLACGHALQGRSDAALDLLDRLADMRVVFKVAEDEDLMSLRELPRFSSLVDRFAAADEPTIASEVAFRLDDPEFVPEDVAWDPVSGDLFVSSIRQRKVVRIDEQGRQSRFAGYPEVPMLAALSMAVDSERRVLWLTTAGATSMIDYRAEEHDGASELIGFDIDSGRPLVRVSAPDDGERHELNDLALESDGAVLVGDAPVGAVYRLRPGLDGFQTVVPPGTMFSPQGIVILPDGGQTLVADYSRGLCVVESDGNVRLLRSPEDAWLGGIDGLSVVSRRELMAVQNGITPSRVVRIRLAEAVDGVAAVEVLDLAHPEHDQPTLGEVVGEDFLYVANSLWGAWDQEGKLEEGRTLTPPVILKIPL